jgi:uncharacterized membrane protein HdeD (DUF308 family)
MSSRDGWTMLARAALSFGFGALLVRREIRLLSELGMVCGAYAVLDGLLAISIAGPRTRQNERFTAFFAQGVVGVAAGVVAMLLPRVWSFVIAAGIPVWAIVHAALTFVGATSIRGMFRPIWLIVIGGLMTLALALLFLSHPGGGLPWLTAVLAAYGFANGVLLIALVPGTVRATN